MTEARARCGLHCEGRGREELTEARARCGLHCEGRGREELAEGVGKRERKAIEY